MRQKQARTSVSFAGMFLAIVLGLACRPKSGTFLVAYVRGDVFLPNMEAELWPLGTSEECYLASGTSFPLDKKGDFAALRHERSVGLERTLVKERYQSQSLRSLPA
jgi:hypothetical protein